MVEYEIHRGARGGYSVVLMPVFMLVGVALLVVLKGGFTIVLFGLMPAVVAYYVDGYKGRPIFKTVGACNAAGVIPYLPALYKAASKPNEMQAMLEDTRIWVFIYCCAAAGWTLLWLARFVARFAISLQYEQKISSLERAQKALVEEWGAEVTGAQPEEEKA